MRTSNHQGRRIFLRVGSGVFLSYAALAFFLLPAACGTDMPGQMTITPGMTAPPARGPRETPPDAARPDAAPAHPDAGTVSQPDGGHSVAPDVGAPEVMAPLPPPPTVVPAGLDLTGGLAVFLPLDEAKLSSMVRDGSGQKNVAALHGFADRQSVWVEGRFGGGLALPGGSNRGWIQVESSPSLNAISSAFTIAVWLFRGPDDSADGTIVARHAGGTTGCLYCFEIRGGGLHLGINTGNGYFGDIKGDRALPRGVWVHVAATFSQGRGNLYMDGLLVGTGAYGLGLAPDLTPVTVGAVQDAAGNSGDFLMGRIDDVLIYSRALASQEIAALAGGFNMSALAILPKLSSTKTTYLNGSSGGSPPAAAVRSVAAEVERPTPVVSCSRSLGADRDVGRWRAGAGDRRDVAKGDAADAPCTGVG